MSEVRIERLEDDIREIRAALARLEPMIIRIDAVLPHLATKAELADLRTDVSTQLVLTKADLADLRTDVSTQLVLTKADLADLRTDILTQLADKPGKIYLWTVFGALIVAYAAGLAGLAVLGHG